MKCGYGDCFNVAGWADTYMTVCNPHRLARSQRAARDSQLDLEGEDRYVRAFSIEISRYNRLPGHRYKAWRFGNPTLSQEEILGTAKIAAPTPGDLILPCLSGCHPTHP